MHASCDGCQKSLKTKKPLAVTGNVWTSEQTVGRRTKSRGSLWKRAKVQSGHNFKSGGEL